MTNKRKLVECLHIQCASTFNLVNDLKFYLLDIYYLNFIRKQGIIKILNKGFNIELTRAKILR